MTLLPNRFISRKYTDLRIVRMALLCIVITLHLRLSSGSNIINTRVIFGTFGNNTIALLASILALLILFVLAKKFNYSIWLYLVEVGLLINIMDRISCSGVIDYFKIGFWPIFNLPDIFIVAGVIGLSFSKMKNHSTKKSLIDI